MSEVENAASIPDRGLTTETRVSILPKSEGSTSGEARHGWNGMSPMSPDDDPSGRRRRDTAKRSADTDREARNRAAPEPREERDATEPRGGESTAPDSGVRRAHSLSENGPDGRSPDEPISRLAKTVAIAVIGSSVLAFGVVLIVLPGPASIVIPIGLAILATEFVWAKKLNRTMGRSLRRLKRRAQRTLRRRPRPGDPTLP